MQNASSRAEICRPQSSRNGAATVFLIHRQALATRERVLGREHPSTLTSVYRLVCLLAQQGCSYESLALHDRTCAGYSIVLGKDRPTPRACRQQCSKAVALQEQTPVAQSLVKVDSGASKTLMFQRRFAKLKMLSVKHKRG